MSATAGLTAVLDRRARLAGLDRLRGLAVLLMVLDHVLVVADVGTPVRLTVTRASMPLFFLIAGSLVRRARWGRLGLVAVLGAVLPVVVPWVDAPNVLLYYAVGAVLLAVVRGRRGRWVALAVAASLAANGYLAFPGAYSPGGLWVLMLAGALAGAPALDRVGARLPAWVARAGRYPLTVYVVHLLALRAVQVAFLGGGS